MNIHNDLCSLIPNFRIGVIRYNDIEIGPSPQMIKGRLQTLQEALYFELEEKNVTELKGIKEWREIFKKTGKDPNRYRHSAEALYRRVKKHQYLSPVNSAADLNNFFSLQYEIPFGIYDLDAISGPIEMRIGKEGETYEGLNGRINNLHSLIITADNEGPFGSPFVDSKRTAVTEKTKNAIQVVYLRPSAPVEEDEKLMTNVMNNFLQIHGGTGNYEIIRC